MSNEQSNQNPQPNLLQGLGNFASDAAVDTTADGLVNNLLGAVEQHVPIPGGQVVDQMIQTGVDQNLNNAINNELNKGVDGMLKDVEGLFGHQQ